VLQRVVTIRCVGNRPGCGLQQHAQTAHTLIQLNFLIFCAFNQTFAVSRSVPLKNCIDFAICSGAVQLQYFPNVPPIVTVPHFKVETNEISNNRRNIAFSCNITVHHLLVSKCSAVSKLRNASFQRLFACNALILSRVPVHMELNVTMQNAIRTCTPEKVYSVQLCCQMASSLHPVIRLPAIKSAS